MLRFVDPSCKRRDFLRIGSLALGGLSLPALRQAQAAQAVQAAPRRGVHDKSVILLFLQGGPSQFETFDPKMTAPPGIRSATGDLETTVPGMNFAGSYEKLARHAHEVSIVRSYASGDGNHDIKPVVGRATLGANMGSLYARVVGNNHPDNGMPTNCALFPRAVDPKAGPAQNGFGNFSSTGTLGSAYQPFTPGGEADFQRNLTLNLARNRLDDRRTLLSGLDRIQRDVDTTGLLDGLDRFREQAFTTILGGVADAFDLSKEDPRTIAKYDTKDLFTADRIDKKWQNYPHYVDHNQTLGKLLLLARRLCERGCGFVTVTTNFVWDNHADVNNVPVEMGGRYCSLALDHALSAFIEDCAGRGLTDKILLVATGEMGRTPRINNNGGRDHWGGLTPLLFTGGGLQMGKVLGQSTKDGGTPQSDPYGIPHLLTTIMSTLLDLSEVRLMPNVPGDIVRVMGAVEPIHGLV